MDANQNPPSEQDWSEQEKEEFFASTDAITGLPNSSLAGTMATNGYPYANTRNLPPGIASSWYMLDFWRAINPGVHIESIVPPESGWPIVAHCDLCKKTVIVLSPWAIKPEKGDYWKMHHTCLDEDLHIKHNMYPQRWSPWREKDALPME
jgi:hypothetical protein